MIDPKSTANFYDSIASDYDATLSRPGDIWVRGAFNDFVAQRVAPGNKLLGVAPGNKLLDFGSGTGLDAEWYAKRGYRVSVFDTSEGMLAKLRSRCSM